MPAQPATLIGALYMVDPALHAGIKFRKADVAIAQTAVQVAQPLCGVAHLACPHKQVAWVKHNTKSGHTVARMAHVG